jgi:hypothetical protein
MPGDHLEVSIYSQKGPLLPQRDRGDQTIHHRAYGFAFTTAGPLDERRVLKVSESFHLEDFESGE